MALQEWIDSKYSSALDAYARNNAALPSLLLIYLHIVTVLTSSSLKINIYFM